MKAGAVNVPYHLDAIATVGAQWRDHFAWPVPLADVFAVAPALLRRITKLVIEASEEDRDVLLLARPIGKVSAIIEAALAIQREERAGIALSGPAELEILRGTSSQNGVGKLGAVSMGDRFLKFDVRFAWARRSVRAMSWTPLGLLPRMLFAPQGTAVTHNGLLRAQLSRGDHAVNFEHAVPYLARLCSEVGPVQIDDERAADITNRLLAVMIADERFDAGSKALVEMLVRPLVAEAVLEAMLTLIALQKARKVPARLYSGTGGFQPARALGMEVLRRGGAVVRADHGGTVALMASGDFVAMQELLVSSACIVPSPAVAMTDAFKDGLSIASCRRTVELLPEQGDLSLRSSSARRDGERRKSASVMPKVLFIGTAYYDFAQTFPPFPPGPVYLDWQHRVLSLLSAMPIDLSHKPHPGGKYNGNPPLLNQYAVTLNAKFEDVVDDFDVLVFDIAASTTFSIALASHKNIVFLDFGCMAFSPAIALEIGRRCRVVPIRTDDRNRLVVDPATLRSSVLDEFEDVDPSYFKALLLADGAYS